MTLDMDCPTARHHLLDDQRGRLDPATAAELNAHLERCPGCAHEEKADRLLTEQLERHLPQQAAPIALKRRLAAQWPIEDKARLADRVIISDGSLADTARQAERLAAWIAAG